MPSLFKKQSSKKKESKCFTVEEDLELGNSANSVMPREYWPHHMDFILSCVGYAVGFGSIWRFPYLCMRNGGGAFLIPYIIFMAICGVPLFFLELAVAQYSSASPLSLWEICPLFKGLGWSMIIISGIVCIYYNVILTWVFYYLVQSMNRDVPWKFCGNEWNTCLCHRFLRDASNNSTMDRNATIQSIYANCSISGEVRSPAEEFWKFNVLDMSDGVGNLGPVRWQLLLCLAVAWVLVFACLCKGVKSVGKVVYFTATSPYIFLFILLVRNCMLEGSYKGIEFYLKPEWSKLLNFSIWAEAALQVFFALGPGWGGLIAMASFNKFHNNCYRDAMVVPVINCLTSLLGGFVIFAVIGHMAHSSGLEVREALEAGPGIVFVAYPEAISNLPISPLWAIFFFLMLITIGLDSQFGMFETMTSSFIDEFPRYLRPRKVVFTAVMCFIEFIIALPLVTRGGIYLFTIMDWYCGTFSLTLIAFLELVVICGIYGYKQFLKDIKAMIGFTPSPVWVVLWIGVTPLTLVGIFVVSIFLYSNPTYGKYEFPGWAIAIGWCLALVSLVPIPVVAIKKILSLEGPIMKRLEILLRPSPSYGPPKHILYGIPSERSSEQADETESM